MYEKNGKYFADWRDRAGKRLRKSFNSPRAALQFEQQQRELAHPKLKALGQRLPIYSAPVTLGSRPATASGKCRKRSSRKLLASVGITRKLVPHDLRRTVAAVGMLELTPAQMWEEARAIASRILASCPIE
jgi:hypothetical protein